MDALEEIKKLQEYYEGDVRQRTFKALVLGESGSGKTFLARTCRLPVFIDSFDPGGSLGLREEIAQGKVVVDTRWEKEDPTKPTAYNTWSSVMEERLKGDFFSHFGTYILDSATTWSTAIMNEQLRRAGAVGQAPKWERDYAPQKNEISKRVYQMMNLPCDFIMTGHVELKQEQGTGVMKFRFMTTGKGAVTIPLLFDEQYVMVTKETSKGTEYQILTSGTGLFLARSRLSADGKLEKHEPADIKAILKKVGFSTEDKALFK